MMVSEWLKYTKNNIDTQKSCAWLRPRRNSDGEGSLGYIFSGCVTDNHRCNLSGHVTDIQVQTLGCTTDIQTRALCIYRLLLRCNHNVCVDTPTTMHGVWSKGE